MLEAYVSTMHDKNPTPESAFDPPTHDSHDHANGLAGRLISIGRDCGAHLDEPFLSADHAELLYDKNGLPPAQD
jgi:hypothetical protein